MILNNERKTFGKILHMLRCIHFKPIYLAFPLSLSLIAAIFEGARMGMLIPILQGFLSQDFSFIKEIPTLDFFLSFLPESIGGSDRKLFMFLIGLFVVIIMIKNFFKYCMLF